MIARRLFRFALAASAGALAGLVVYALSSLRGYSLHVASGVLVGLAIAGILEISSRRLNLAEVSLSVPQLTRLTFVVDDEARQTAWRLFVEVSTRVTTQPLRAEEGFGREALNSLHGLFGETRTLLKQARPSVVSKGTTVEYLALAMLNGELRPFLSVWHPRLSSFERSGMGDEASWKHHSEFRGDLEEVRRRLLTFAISFARLAGVTDAKALVHGLDHDQLLSSPNQ